MDAHNGNMNATSQEPSLEPMILRDGRTLTLRPIRPDDADAFRVFMLTLASDTPWIGSGPDEIKDVEWFQDRIEQFTDRAGSRWEIAVSEQHHAIVGDCMALPGSRAKFEHVAMIGIGIIEPWRGVGLGRMLMERTISWARESALIDKLELGFFDDNNAARNLYTSLGFHVEGVRTRAIRQPDGSYHDDVLMGLWVGDDPAEDPI